MRGGGSNDTYESAAYAEERLKEVKHIYLLYNVNQLTDTVDITKGAGVDASLNPEIEIICQNISSVDPAYAITVTGINIPSVTTNLGKKWKKWKGTQQQWNPFDKYQGSGREQVTDPKDYIAGQCL